MNINGLIDCHTHCRFSPDGEDDPILHVTKAKELGLRALALTDHCECNTWFEPEHYGINSSLADEDDIIMYNCRSFHLESLDEMGSLKENETEDFAFVHGVELGQPLQALDIAKSIIENKNLDFVIGSLHNNADMPDFYYLKYDEMAYEQISALLEDYFHQVLDMCKWGEFDVLGHLTYPLRYITGKYGIQVDLKTYRDICTEIFSVLIGQGKGIEINTSGLFTDYKTTMPDKDLVKMYKDLGGEILSLGSDAHRADKVGQGIDTGAQIVRDCGFKYCAFFKQHKPVFVKL